jgi:hypothetical protein
MIMALDGFDGVKVFAATMIEQRAHLGEHVTAWLRSHSDRVPVAVIVRQSSDARFHCLSILIFWRTQSPA